MTFEDAEVDYGLTDFGGNLSEIVADPEDPANTVVRSVKTDTSELWAGTTVGGSAGFANPHTLRTRSHYHEHPRVVAPGRSPVAGQS